MKAVVCKQFGPPEKLVIEERPEPRPGADEIVIQMRAAGVTFPDALMIEDRYQYKPQPPFVPGGEVAGVVKEVGSAVQGLAPGDRVVAGLGNVGGFAELVCTKAAAARRIPEAMDFGEATGLLYAYGTGWYGLVTLGELQRGETLLVLGAAGQVGLAAVEIGALRGARVIAAASSAEKLALCRSRGADETIDYTTEDLKVRAKELTEQRGVDVVYDAVGGDYAEPSLRATAWGGRYLVIGFTAGIPRLPLNLPLLKGCRIQGVFFGAMTAREPDTLAKISDELLALAERGELRPHVSRRYPLGEAGQALRDLLERRAVGKVVIVPEGEGSAG